MNTPAVRWIQRFRDEETVREIVAAITSAYIGEFGKLRDRLQQLEREGGAA